MNWAGKRLLNAKDMLWYLQDVVMPDVEAPIDERTILDAWHTGRLVREKNQLAIDVSSIAPGFDPNCDGMGLPALAGRLKISVEQLRYDIVTGKRVHPDKFLGRYYWCSHSYY